MTLGASPVRSAFRFHPDVDVWSVPYYRELARAVASSPVGVGFLFEQVNGEDGPSIVPSGAAAESLLPRAVEAVAGRLERLASIPDPDPPGETDLWIGSFRSVGRTHETPAEEQRLGSTVANVSNAGERGALLPSPGEPVAPLPLLTDAWSVLRTRWTTRGDGRVRVRLELMVAVPRSASRREALVAAVPHLRRFEATGFPRLELQLRPSGTVARRRWSAGRLPWWRTGPVIPLKPETAAAGLASWPLAPFPRWSDLNHHVALVGASGSGKTAFLASLAAEGIARGHPVVVLDAHGDLAPAIVDSLPADLRSKVVAIDPTSPGYSGPGIPVLDAGDPSTRMRLASQVVASLRRLSSDGGDLYWGFRLERIFDTFVRLVQEESGNLLDLYELLTDERRREASRLATRDADAARFLEELDAIVRRNPEFLWAAAARLVKVVVDSRLAALLAPRNPDFPVDQLLGERRGLLVRLPIGEFGPEGAGFALSLLAARIYFDRTRGVRAAADAPRLLLVLDEVHLFSPRLVAEILAEGRKFGVAVVLATQYPERLAPEVEHAVTGAVGTHVVFRVPRSGAAGVASWIGLTPGQSEPLLAALPPGMAVVSAHGASATRRTIRLPPPPQMDLAAWNRAARDTHERFAGPSEPAGGPASMEAADEALLLAVFGAEASNRRPGTPELIARAIAIAPASVDASALASRLTVLLGRGYLSSESAKVSLTPAGRRYLGYGARSGATRESQEHRHLLLEAFRIFAGKGHRIDIVRQGRFDKRLPDAVYRQLRIPRGASGPTIAAEVDRARAGWAWRFFHGKDVYLEAEVSGALRPARIRRGLAKARDQGAYALFLVADPGRGRRVHRTLTSDGIPQTRAQVWILRRAQPYPPGAGAGKEELSITTE